MLPRLPCHLEVCCSAMGRPTTSILPRHCRVFNSQHLPMNLRSRTKHIHAAIIAILLQRAGSLAEVARKPSPAGAQKTLHIGMTLSFEAWQRCRCTMIASSPQV